MALSLRPRFSPRLSFSSSTILLTSTLLLFSRHASAHGHHDKLPDGAFISDDPIDGILWTHILLMILSFGIIYPLGMVLGLVKSKWHVPTQILGTVVAVPAYFLGHMHKGRQFKSPNIHATFANSLVLMTVVQVGIGVGLKLHLEEKKGWLGRVFGGKVGRSGRRGVVIVHGVLGKAMPVVAWTQMLFGGIVAQGFCRGEHTGQCLAHFIMGSAFIGYGIIMTVMMLVGQVWLRRTGKSQEFFDSAVIAAWGCVNTFTEHRWGTPWVKNDLQHTSMGIVWWCAGLLGIWLSRSRGGRPRRNVLPGLVILLTGWAMSAHPQELPLSSMVHTVFGWTLMAAGAARIVEICFLLKDSRGNPEPSSWQHLPPFLLYASGLLFMSAQEEQMQLFSKSEVTHVSVVLIIYSFALMMYLFVNILLHIYATHTWPNDESNGAATAPLNTMRQQSIAVPGSSRAGWHSRKPSLYSDMAGANGSAAPKSLPRMPKHRGTESQQIRDVEEFELEGLIEASDSDDGSPSSSGSGSGRKKEGTTV